jgi:hypothetical protein
VSSSSESSAWIEARQVGVARAASCSRRPPPRGRIRRRGRGRARMRPPRAVPSTRCGFLTSIRPSVALSHIHIGFSSSSAAATPSCRSTAAKKRLGEAWWFIWRSFVVQACGAYVLWMWWQGGEGRRWRTEVTGKRWGCVARGRWWGCEWGWRRKGRRSPQGRAEALQVPVNVQELRRFSCCVGGLYNES